MSHNLSINISGVPGEVTEKGYEKYIGVLSFSHGISMPVNRSHTNVSSPSGTAVHQDFTITKYLDSTDPPLLARVMGGSNISEIKFVVLEADTEKGATVPLYTIDFKHAILTSHSTGGSIGDKPVITITFLYHSIKFEFQKHKNVTPGGVPGKVPAGWDLSKNIPL
jgi:type VI secretion system Hcp family effector